MITTYEEKIIGKAALPHSDFDSALWGTEKALEKMAEVCPEWKILEIEKDSKGFYFVFERALWSA